MRPALPIIDSDLDPVLYPASGTPPLPLVYLPPRSPSPPGASAVDMHDLLRGVIHEHDLRIRAGHLQVSLRLLARTYQIAGDRERLRQVLRNLLSTAIQSTARGGQVTIRSSCPSDGAFRIEIEQRLAKAVATA